MWRELLVSTYWGQVRRRALYAPSPQGGTFCWPGQALSPTAMLGLSRRGRALWTPAANNSRNMSQRLVRPDQLIATEPFTSHDLASLGIAIRVHFGHRKRARGTNKSACVPTSLGIAYANARYDGTIGRDIKRRGIKMAMRSLWPNPPESMRDNCAFSSRTAARYLRDERLENWVNRHFLAARSQRGGA
jgi:hypothetical protein